MENIWVSINRDDGLEVQECPLGYVNSWFSNINSNWRFLHMGLLFHTPHSARLYGRLQNLKRSFPSWR